MRWTGYVTSMREVRNAYILIVKNFNGRAHFRDLNVDGKIALNWS
jgi:hypothetical protein